MEKVKKSRRGVEYCLDQSSCAVLANGGGNGTLADTKGTYDGSIHLTNVQGRDVKGVIRRANNSHYQLTKKTESDRFMRWNRAALFTIKHAAS